MFAEIKDKWETSQKEKTDKLIYLKELHNAILNMKDLAKVLEGSLVNRLEIDKEGIFISTGKKDIKLFINDNDYEEVPMSVLCFGSYEEEETNMVLRLLSYLEEDKFTVFDIGANVGWYTLNIQETFGEKATVYAFEPSPLTYKRLVNNLILNGKKEEYAINIGFYRESGTMEFFYDQEGSGASSLVNLREKEEIEIVPVDMKSMDEWVGQNAISKIDFIKCDVEGSELFVYEGGTETIKKNLPIIFSEMLRKWSSKFGYCPNDIIHFMNKLGYACYVIYDSVYLREITEVDEKTVETNYFFLHRDKHAKIISDLVR